MNDFKRLLSAAAAVSLAACSGGSSGGGGGAPAIDIAYAGPTSAVVISDTAAIDKLILGVRDAGSNVSGTAGSAGVTAAVAQGPKVGAAIALDLLARVRSTSVATAAGVTGSQTIACPFGGSIWYTETIADGTRTITTRGDTFSEVFQGCNLGGLVVTGSTTVTITATDGALFLSDPPVLNADTTYGVSVVYRDFALDDGMGFLSGLEGDATLSQIYRSASGWFDATTSGSSLVWAVGVNGTVTSGMKLTSFTIEGGEHYPSGLNSFPDGVASGTTARLCSFELGGCVNVTTSPRFVYWDSNVYGYPESGSMTVRDDSNNYVTVTVVDGTGNVSIKYKIGAAAEVTVAATWSCLATDTCVF